MIIICSPCFLGGHQLYCLMNLMRVRMLSYTAAWMLHWAFLIGLNWSQVFNRLLAVTSSVDFDDAKLPSEILTAQSAGHTVYDRAQEAIHSLKLKLVPWAAVAAPVTQDRSEADAGMVCFHD